MGKKEPENNNNDPFLFRLANYGAMSLAVAAAMTARPAQAAIIASPDNLNVSTSSTGNMWFGFTPSTPAATNVVFSFGLYRTSFRSSKVAYFEWGNNIGANVLANSTGYAVRLAAGNIVGSIAPAGDAFTNYAPIARTFTSFYYSSSSSSLYSLAQRKFAATLGEPFYLGLELTGGANPLFGWAEVQLDPNTFDVNLIQFAYQDDGSAIVTGDIGEVPEPASIYLVALGAIGMAAYKRRQRKRA